jgi:host cell factor
MFIFGGKGPNGAYYKDIYFLDLVEWIWVPVSTLTQGPSARFFHASEAVGRKLVVHGGWNNSDVYNDLWIFNTDSFSWTQPRTSGFGPTARYGHSLTLTQDGRLFIFGGMSLNKDTGIPKYNDDVRQLDTDTMVWVRPRVDGSCPTGRFGHTSVLMDDGKIMIFGGWGRGGCQCPESISDIRAHTVHVLDTNSMNWWTPHRLGKKPVKHLYSHGAVKAAGSSSVLIFGGFDGRQACNDFYVANLDFGENL